MELKPLEHGSRDISIEIGFRALSLNGLLFYTGHLNAKKGDFISIAIINGSLELRYLHKLLFLYVLMLVHNM